MRDKTILFSICSLGLGHATRSFPVIIDQLKRNKIIIYSDRGALKLLKHRLKGKNVKFYEKKVPYSSIERGKGNFAYQFFLLKDSLNMLKVFKREKKDIKEICDKESVDIIFSDGNYCSYHESIPSFLLTHQIEFKIKNKIYKKLGRNYNIKTFNKYTQVLIPDYQSKKINLAGELSHFEKTISKIPHTYVGILSQFKQNKTKQNIDYLVIISGFLHEHKEEFFNNLLRELKGRKGKKVFIMGDYSKDYTKKIGKDITIHSSFKKLNQDKIFNSSKVIISRTGYSTLMDIVELEKDSLLIPTPNQSEQEYLSEYHKNKNLFNTLPSQKNIKFNKIKSTKNNLKKLTKTQKSVKKIDLIFSDCFVNK